MDFRSLGLIAVVAGCGVTKDNRQTVDAGDADAPVVIDATIDAAIDAPPANPFVNGSFEQDYLGWTLTEDSGDPASGIWGIATDGMTFTGGTPYFDFTDGIDVAPGCAGGQAMPVSVVDGTKAAFQLQGGPERHLLEQTLTIPAGLTTLSWSMAYETSSLDPTRQFLAVEVRSPATGATLATMFTTDVAGAPMVQAMQNFTGQITQFAGQQVRITVDLQVQNDCFTAVFDDFRIR